MEREIEDITYLRGTVDILNGEDLSQSEEEDLGKGRNKLGCRHEDINTILSLCDHVETLEGQCWPIVRGYFYILPNFQPLLPFLWPQKASDTAKYKETSSV